ncbi:hypothetical protein GCM10027449_26570 [Sinomonas notoginsengisoli]|uniref:hypothetical protein n=1 Tax=Sinomonas notoginsengisoli TaxID=1457311 RepID=UPI001F403C48|nr:hypothetical protein [Sinomonas notoginsengisoli]
MSSCTKCHRPTVDCPGCNGGRNLTGIVGRLTCKECGESGQVCPEHGRFWK